MSMTAKRTWLHLLYLLYCAEAGIYLLLVPWSMLWMPMAFRWPAGLRGVLISGAARGAVSAFGGFLIRVAWVDLVRFCRTLRAS